MSLPQSLLATTGQCETKTVCCIPEQRVILNISYFRKKKTMIKNWMCTDLLGAERTKDKKYRLNLQCDAFSYTIQSDYIYNIELILNP